MNNINNTPNSKLQIPFSAQEYLRHAALRLREAKIESAALDARLLVEKVLGVTREELLFSLDLKITPAQYAELETLLDARVARKPIAQIIGKREFWGKDFLVSGATLIPRPDSETLVESVLERLQDKSCQVKILDLGTGSGCLLLSLLAELSCAYGIGVDLSPEAIAVAKQNAEILGLKERTEFINSNWGQAIRQKFDIVISNPPYIPTTDILSLEPEVAEFEPKTALDGGNDGLDCYREIISDLPNLLKNDGFAVFEIGMGQEDDLVKIAGKHGLKPAGQKKDLGGITRCVILEF